MTVERIFILKVRGGPQVECTTISVVAGAGIEGDRNFAQNDDPGQNISLIEAEEIEAFFSESREVRDISVTRRNIVTRGVRLNDLVGKDFMIGEVKLRGVELCEPCALIGRTLASADYPVAAVVKRLTNRAGLRTNALSSGDISRGAKVKNAVQPYGQGDAAR